MRLHVVDADVTSPQGQVATGTANTSSSPTALLPVLPSLRSLILGELDMPPLEEPQPIVDLAALFPGLENMLAFSVVDRGLALLARLNRLKRLVLRCVHLRDAVWISIWARVAEWRRAC